MKSDSQTVSIARELARQAHEGQYRHDGVTPYITHPERIAAKVRHHGPKMEAIALLHDVLEDTAITLQGLRGSGLPDEVVDVVSLLTRPKDESYASYLQRVCSNEYAWTVKIADILDNLGDSPHERQIIKYSRALLFLYRHTDTF